ncbi:AsmA family protein [Achromobacter aloeverae]|uniref:AsmA family protein n=1 Tax=Achromobacter aloeverae TaxID=1750518 RepID=A0A4Q1HKA2_9BURK|nr:AsmA family protein [Achromobacter aloeverae]RXN90556.1 AsmA family protein [Achromobacter aloeverae]
MKTWIKRIVLALAILVAVVVAAAAVFVLTFDPNAYKARLQEMVSQRFHRTLIIDGDIDMTLFPTLGLTLQGVSLTEPGRDELFASVEDAQVSVAIWPLLSKKLVIDHLTFSGVKARVVRDKQGRFNFADLVGGPAPVAATPDATPDASATQAAAGAPAALGQPVAGNAAASPMVGGMRIDIAGVDLKDGELQLQDDRAGLALTVTQLEATTGRVRYDQPFPVKLSAHLQGTAPVLDADLTGQAKLSLNPAGPRYAAEDMNLRLGGRLGDAQAKSLTARGKLGFDGGKLDAAGLELVFEGDVRDPGHPLSNVEATIAAPALMFDPARHEMRVDKLTVRAKGSAPRGPFELALDAPALSLTPAGASGATLGGRLRLNGSDSVDVRFGLKGIGGNVDALSVEEVKAQATISYDVQPAVQAPAVAPPAGSAAPARPAGKPGTRDVAITLASPLTLDLARRTGALPSVQGNIAITDPGLPQGAMQIPLTGAVSVDLAQALAEATVNAQLEGGKFDLKASVAQLATQPAITFALAVDQLDLDKLVPAGAPRPPAAGPAGKGKADAPVQPSAPADAAAQADAVDFSALAGATAKGTVSIGKLVARGLRADAVSGNVALARGRLELSGLSAALYGGKLAGAFSLDAERENAMSARLNLNGLAVGPFLADVAGRRALTGTGDVALDLKTKGADVGALKRQLSGAAQVRLRDGAVQGINVGQVLRDIKALVLSGKREDSTEVQADASRETAFSRLSADLAFANGVGTFKQLELVSPLLHVTQGSPARIDVGADTVDLVAQVRIADAPPRSEGLDELRGLGVPVHVHGPYDHLAYRVDWRAMAGDLAARALQRGLKDAFKRKSGKPEERLKDLGNVLKGITGK